MLSEYPGTSSFAQKWIKESRSQSYWTDSTKWTRRRWTNWPSTRLTLVGAVTLRPLEHHQIDAYLDASGATGLRNLLAIDAALDELAQVPLTLSMMTLASAA